MELQEFNQESVKSSQVVPALHRLLVFVCKPVDNRPVPHHVVFVVAPNISDCSVSTFFVVWFFSLIETQIYKYTVYEILIQRKKRLVFVLNCYIVRNIRFGLILLWEKKKISHDSFKRTKEVQRKSSGNIRTS